VIGVSGGAMKLFYFYVSLIPIWFLVGLLDFNFYVVSDFYYLIFGVVVFTAFFNALYYEGGEGLESTSLYYTFILVTFLIVALRFFGLATPMEVVVIISVYSVLYVFLGVVNFRKFLLVLILIVISASSNRAFFLQFLVLSLIILSARFGVFRVIFPFLLFIVFSGFLLNSYSYEIKEVFNGTGLERRVNESIDVYHEGVSSKTSIPLLQRSFEAAQVENFYFDNPQYLIFGKGVGATLDMSNSEDDSVVGSQLVSADSTHNVHYLHYAILYRYGLIGCLVFIIFFMFGVFSLYRGVKEYDQKLRTFMLAFGGASVVSMYVFSIFASSFIFSNPLWVIGFASLAFYRVK
jgi:hypothetical protein